MTDTQVAALKREAEDVIYIIEEGLPEVTDMGIRDLLFRMERANAPELQPFIDRLSSVLN